MGIKMNTYAGGQMTAGNDAILHDRAIANTGILHGCNITFMGANQVHIEKGYLLIKGRYCTVTDDTIQVAMSNSETELPGRLYVRADLADAQEPVKILSVATDPLPKLTQDENFNYDNGVWEMELATYTAGMTAIKDLTVTCEEVPEGASKEETAALLGKIDELTENVTWKQLLLIENIPSSFTQYKVQWRGYKELLFVYGFYANVLETIIEPVFLFETHNGEGNRIIFGDSDEVEIYASLPNSDEAMFIKNSGRTTNLLRIYGR